MIFVKAYYVIKGNDMITHEQRIMGNGVLIISPHDFEHPSLGITNYRKLKKYNCGLCSNCIISIRNVMKIRHPFPIYYMAETVVPKATDRWQHELFS
jgi:hypothetical protein